MGVGRKRFLRLFYFHMEAGVGCYESGVCRIGLLLCMRYGIVRGAKGSFLSAVSSSLVSILIVEWSGIVIVSGKRSMIFLTDGPG